MADGAVVIVTGASEGIGRAIARRRLAHGDRVVITGRRLGVLEKTAQTLGGEVLAVRNDARAPGAAAELAEVVMGTFGRIDAIIANAAAIPSPGPLMEAAEGDIDAVWQTNVAAPLRLIRAAWHSGMRDRGGRVVLVGSLGGISFQPGMGLYSASKAALHHLTRILAAELGPGVRVNAIAPGLIRTEGSRRGWEAAENTVRRRSPLARLGEVDDVADAADFLLDSGSSWMTGHVLVLDGGASVQLARPA